MLWGKVDSVIVLALAAVTVNEVEVKQFDNALSEQIVTLSVSLNALLNHA